MFILRFFKYLPAFLSQSIGWTQMMYLCREGVDPKTPASIRWEAELKRVSKPPETDRERLMPIQSSTIILKDLTMLKPDSVIYFTNDSEKADRVMEKLKHDLFTMPCHEFYERWVVHPNYDFLITESDRIDFAG